MKKTIGSLLLVLLSVSVYSQEYTNKAQLPTIEAFARQGKHLTHDDLINLIQNGEIVRRIFITYVVNLKDIGFSNPSTKMNPSAKINAFVIYDEERRPGVRFAEEGIEDDGRSIIVLFRGNVVSTLEHSARSLVSRMCDSPYRPSQVSLSVKANLLFCRAKRGSRSGIRCRRNV